MENDGKMETHKKIYASLLKRDSKEKQVVLSRVIQANDALIACVEFLKTDLDEMTNKYERVLEHSHVLKTRISELEALVRMKDEIITKMSHS